MGTIFIDCTYLRDHNTLNTGIQRVVRHTIEELEKLAPEKGYKIQLLYLKNGALQAVDLSELYPVDSDTVRETDALKSFSLKDYLKNLYYHTRLWVSALIPYPPFQNFVLGPKDKKKSLNHIVYFYIYTPVNVLISKLKSQRNQDGAIQAKEGDVLLLLDSSWYMNIWKGVEKLKKEGACVVMISYDIIPISHPEFCDDFLSTVFSEWVGTSAKYVDGYIAISQTVSQELEKYLHQLGNFDTGKTFSHFYLGSDFKKSTAENPKAIRPELKSLFELPTYLMVSTIEPRKNHAYLLDAFEKVWGKGLQVNLLFIGRRGWKVDALLKRIEDHPMAGRHLFFYDDIDDNELAYAYSHAKALVFPSIVEGFGLPIVEGLSYGLPVLASDTPIHREVGGDRVAYFDLNDTSDLANIIEKWERGGVPPSLIPSEDYRWLTWEESAGQLLENIQNICSNT